MRDAVTQRNEVGEPVEQLHDPPEALRRQRIAGCKVMRRATHRLGQELFVRLPMLAHVGTSHVGTGHGPGGVRALAGATSCL